MTIRELKALTNQQLIDNFQKAIELDTKNGGNDKSSFDATQLKGELLQRMEKENIVNSYPYEVSNNEIPIK